MRLYPGSSSNQIYRVTFKDGDEEIYRGRYVYEKVGDLPTKEDATGKKFLMGWYNGDTKAESGDPVTADITYEAKWGDAIAEYNGTKYTTLQAAIDAATQSGSEATVKLLNDTTEAVTVSKGAKLTLDLNGKTLAAPSTGTNLDAIKLTGVRELVVDNGAISSTSRCVYADYEVSTGSTITLGSQLTCTSSGANPTIFVEGRDKLEPGSKLTILGGSYTNTSTGGPALRIDGDGTELSIVDGVFTSGAGDTIYIGDTAETNLSCDISGHIYLTSYAKGKVNIQSGTTFGDDTNKSDIDATTYHLLKNPADKYEVSAHTLKTVIDKEPTDTTAGSKHEECTVEGCGYKSAPEVIPAGSDTKAPVINGLAAGAAYDVSKTFTVTEENDFTVTVNGETVAKNADGSFTLPYGEGMTVVATDEAGNSSSVANVSNFRDHEWGSAVADADGEHHTYTCAHSACEVKTKQESHAGGKATCAAAAVCTKCGASYGEKDSTNHVDAESGWTYDSTNHWHKCTGCGEAYPNTTVAHDLKTVIDVEPTATTTGSKHQECKVCDYKGASEVIPSTGDAPVISGIVDGDSYDLEDDKPTFTVSAANLKSVTVNGEEVTASSDGKYTINVAGDSVVVVASDANGKSTTVTISCSEKHKWGKWQGNGNGTHFRECENSGCQGYQQRDCNGGTATCASQAVCADCGLAYGEKDSTNHAGTKSWNSDSAEHWQTCDDCGAEIADSRAKHNLTTNYDESGHWSACDTCGYKSEKVAHTLVRKSDEDGHWTECSECDYKTEKTAHTLTWVTTKEATATEEGLKHQECSECGYKGADVVIPATGDDSDDGDKGGADDKGGSDEKGSGSKDGTVIPQTGDVAGIASAVATAGAALAGIGTLRRRK